MGKLRQEDDDGHFLKLLKKAPKAKVHVIKITLKKHSSHPGPLSDFTQKQCFQTTVTVY